MSRPGGDGSQPRVGLISPCGWGNLGDAAIIASVLDGARARLPGVGFVAFTMNPADTRDRHGIEAMPVSGFERPGYRVVGDPDPDPADDAPVPSSVLRRVLDRPGPRDIATALRLWRADREHGRRIDDVVRGFDLVVVAGGGQFDDFWGGALGHPYALARWARRARRLGVPFRILSVGTGTLTTPLARAFVRDAIRHATSLSFRDEGSRALVGADDAPVIPDLAYGLDVERAPLPSDDVVSIAISPMSYADPRFWAEPDQPRYDSYIRRLGELGRLLVERGHELIVVSTNRSDDQSVRDLVDAVGPVDRLRVVDTPDHRDYLAAVAGCSVVVASRLHGVLLAHVAGRPALAISYDRKVDVLMRDAGHADLCVDVDRFEPGDAAELVGSIVKRREVLAAEVVEAVERRAAAVAEQYDTVFGSIGGAGRSGAGGGSS